MRKFYLLTLLLFSTLLVGQTNPQNRMFDIVPSSPMATEMTRFVSQQPNLYTGTHRISIPLHTIDFDGWGLPLTLDYTASGITTNQEATEVGLGWVLNANAVITRQVKKNNDLQHNLYTIGYVIDPEDHNEYLKNLYNPDNPEFFDELERNHISQRLEPNFIDSEPDLFSYSFFGFSGRFSLSKKDANNQVKVIKHSKDGVSIEFDFANRKFTLLTPTGFKGYFTIKERTTNLVGAAPNNGRDPDFEQESYGGHYIDIINTKNRGALRTITAWYLSKIVSPKGKEIIFNYNFNDTEESPHLSISRPLTNEIKTLQDHVSFSRQLVEHAYLSSIEIPKELKINFEMEDREDLEANFLFLPLFQSFNPKTKPQRYTQINFQGLQEHSTFKKNITLHQSYFNLEALYEGTYPNLKYQKLRGRLDAITIDDETYSLQYEEGKNGLPNKSTKAMDHFGFYNGNDLNTTLMKISRHILWHNNLIFKTSNLTDLITYQIEEVKLAENIHTRYFYFNEERTPNFDYAKAGLLKKMILPTQGYIDYEYESHSYNVSGGTSLTKPNDFPQAINASGKAGTVSAGGARIKSIAEYDHKNTISTKKTFSYTQSNESSSGILINPFLYVQLQRDIFSPEYFAELEEKNPPGPGKGPVEYVVFESFNSLIGLNSANGRKIGYSMVKQFTKKGNTSFKETYLFHNEKTGYLNSKLVQTSDGFMNGKLLNSYHYDTFKLVKSVENKYNDAFESEHLFVNYHFLEQPDEGIVIVTPYKIPNTQGELLEQTVKHYYDYSSIENVEQKVSYQYNSIKQSVRSEKNTSSDKKTRVVTKHLIDYPHTVCVNSQEGGCLYEIIKEKNILAPVLEEITYLGDKVLAATAYRYDIEHGNIVLKEVLEHNRSKGTFVASSDGFQFGNTYESRIHFDAYDKNGKLLQMTPVDGIPTSYVWGYDQNYPIVKATGVTHNQLLTAHNAATGSNYEEKIRNHPSMANAMISTYQYNPLVGVSQITAPSSQKNTFEYDQYNRLSNIRGTLGNSQVSYSRNYADLPKVGNLTTAAYLSFGVVNPGNKKTNYLTIENKQSFNIDVTGLKIPQHFSSPWQGKSFIIPAYTSFRLPIVFNAPLVEQELKNQVLQISTSQGEISSSLSAVSGIETRVLVLPKTCIAVTNEFQTVQIPIQNTGNSPLKVTSIMSDDICFKIPESVLGKTIEPGATYSLSLTLGCPLNSQNNWDRNTRITIHTDGTNTLKSQSVQLQYSCN